METIVGLLVIILVPVAVAAMLIRRILGRKIKKQQTEWERAISEVRSKVRWVI